jgi:hypothetical protein
MPKDSPKKGTRKGRPQSFDWDAWADPLCVGEPGWEEEQTKVWDCTMCKKYVKMTHIQKLWPRERVEKQASRWEGQTSTCQSEHFKQRYIQVHRVLGIKSAKWNVMNYNVMAMVWAEIVLHKDVDWRTAQGRNVDNYNRTNAVIDTQWTGASDCMPEWSNRGYLQQPSVVLKDAEDEWSDEDDDDDDVQANATFGERHERAEERERIEFEQQMEEATRRSLVDRGRHDRHGGSYQREHRTGGSEQGTGGSYYGYNPQSGHQGEGRSYGTSHYDGSSASGFGYGPPSQIGFGGGRGSYDTTQHSGSSGYGSYYTTPTQMGFEGSGGSHATPQYGGSTHGSAQYYPGSTGSDPYGHRGGSSYSGANVSASPSSAPVPPPTFGNTYYGQGGAPSSYHEYYGGGPFIGVQPRGPVEKDETDSDSE